MNLRQMEVFRAFMLTQSVSDAARMLGISQPSVSGVLKHLEDNLRIKLFSRSKGRLVPTPNAEHLFEEVRHAWGGLERVRQVSRGLHRGLPPFLRIGASTNLSIDIVPAALARIRTEYPDVELTLDLMTPIELKSALLDNKIDVGLVMMGVEHPSLVTTKIGSARIMCVMPGDDELCGRSAVSAPDLAQREIIAQYEDLPEWRLVHPIFQMSGVDVVSHVRVRSSQSACRLAQAGVGVALVDEFTASPRAFAGVCIRPFLPELRMNIAAVWRMHRPPDLVASRLVATVRELIADSQHGANEAGRNLPI